MRDFWDKRSIYRDNVNGVEPNVFFKTFIKGIQPGRVLLPSDIEGRNAVFASGRGWKVNTFDFCLSARKKALDYRHGKDPDSGLFLADIEFYELEEEMYDVIALIHVYFQPHNRTYIHRKLINSLRTGGFIILEAFDRDQPVNGHSGISDEERLYSVYDLQDDFSTMDIETFYREVIELNGPGFSSGQANVIRMVALKR